MPEQAAPGNEQAFRVLIAKPGLDGHDRGARVVVRALREAGFDVAYTGIRKTPDEIAQQARDFGAELVGLSILSGAHRELVPAVIEALQRHGLETAPVVAGGIIPERDRAALLEMGVAAIFGPGARTAEIIRTLSETIEAALTLSRRRAPRRRGPAGRVGNPAGRVCVGPRRGVLAWRSPRAAQSASN